MVGTEKNLKITSEQLHDFEQSSRLEWLVTNGIGGYASGSLSGANTRSYHGYLIAASPAPAVRVLSFAKIEESVHTLDNSADLSANIYPGAVQPQGYTCLSEYDPSSCPTFVFDPLPGLRLTKKIWMAMGGT